jgi:hypothetical protein
MDDTWITKCKDVLRKREMLGEKKKKEKEKKKNSWFTKGKYIIPGGIKDNIQRPKKLN